MSTTPLKTTHVKYGSAIYLLSPAVMRKWSEKHFLPSLAADLGKRVFEYRAGEWFPSPYNFADPKPVGEVDSKDGRIIHYGTLDANKMSANEIAAHVQKAARKGKNTMSHYKALLAESKKVGWPKAYETDLTKHDNRELTYRDESLPFGWILRDSGTHLVFPEEKSSVDTYQPKKVANTFGSDVKFYAWDGTALRNMSAERWAHWMQEQHEASRENSSR